MKLKLLFTLMLGLTTIHPSLAAEKTQIKFPDQYKVDFSEFSYRPQNVVVEDHNTPLHIEIGANAWAPSQIVLPGRLSNNESFTSVIPVFSLSALAGTLWTGKLGTLQGRVALDYTQMHRQALLADGLATTPQNLYLIPLELGVRFNPAALNFKSAQIYVLESFVPTLAFTDRSAYDDGNTYLGLLETTQIGVEFNLPQWIDKMLEANFVNHLILDVHGLFTAGTLKDNSIATAGFGAGIGMTL